MALENQVNSLPGDSCNSFVLARQVMYLKEISRQLVGTCLTRYGSEMHPFFNIKGVMTVQRCRYGSWNLAWARRSWLIRACALMKVELRHGLHAYTRKHFYSYVCAQIDECCVDSFESAIETLEGRVNSENRVWVNWCMKNVLVECVWASFC